MTQMFLLFYPDEENQFFPSSAVQGNILKPSLSEPYGEKEEIIMLNISIVLSDGWRCFLISLLIMVKI